MRQNRVLSIVYVLAALGISVAIPAQAQVEQLAGTWAAVDDTNYSLYGPVSIDTEGNVEFTESFTSNVNGEEIFFFVRHTGRIFLNENSQFTYAGDALGNTFGLQGEVELSISVSASGIVSEDLNMLAAVWSTVETYVSPEETNTVESAHPILLFRGGEETGDAAEAVAGVWDVTLTGNTVDWNGTVVIDPSGAMTGEYASLAGTASSLAGLSSLSETGEFHFEYTTVTNLPIIGESTFTIVGEGQANDDRTEITGEWEFTVATNTGREETFTGTFTFTKVDMPELAVRRFELTEDVLLLPDAIVGPHLELEVVNRGTQSVGPFFYAFYLSNDRRVTTDDWLLSGGRVHFDGVIAPGESVTLHITDSMAMPSDWASGLQYLSVIVDEQEEIPEANENNNVAMIPVQVPSPGELLPDLLPLWFELDVEPRFAPGDSIGPHIDSLIANEGLAGSEGFFISLYLSFDDELSDGDAPIDGSRLFIEEGILAGHERLADFGENVSLPHGLDPGVYYLGIAVDESEEVFELDEENNIRWIEIEVGGEQTPVTDWILY